jgi:TatD DNase family protein
MDCSDRSSDDGIVPCVAEVEPPMAHGELGDVPVFFDTEYHIRKKHHYRTVAAPTPALEALVADTHAHFGSLGRPDIALARCAAHGVGFVCYLCDVVDDLPGGYESFDQMMADGRSMCSTIEPPIDESRIPKIRLGCGCHPENAKSYNDDVEHRLEQYLQDPRTCIVGEIGLDYHFDTSPRNVQQQVFRRQIRLAHRFGLPIALHVREAHADALKILREEGVPKAGCILHCFNLGPEDVKPWIDLGCYIAFGGPLTFKKADEVREAARLVPLDRLLTETDCPYMAPVPVRGMECAPDDVVFTAARLAEVRGCMPGQERATFLRAIYSNACMLLDTPRCAELSMGPSELRRKNIQSAGIQNKDGIK